MFFNGKSFSGKNQEIADMKKQFFFGENEKAAPLGDRYVKESN